MQIRVWDLSGRIGNLNNIDRLIDSFLNIGSEGDADPNRGWTQALKLVESEDDIRVQVVFPFEIIEPRSVLISGRCAVVECKSPVSPDSVECQARGDTPYIKVFRRVITLPECADTYRMRVYNYKHAVELVLPKNKSFQARKRSSAATRVKSGAGLRAQSTGGHNGPHDRRNSWKAVERAEAEWGDSFDADSKGSEGVGSSEL